MLLAFSDKQPKNSPNSIQFTYSDFLCRLKVNTNRLVLINRVWECKKGTSNSITKIDKHDGFRPLWRSGGENSAHSRNQSDCRIVESLPLTSSEKDKKGYHQKNKRIGEVCHFVP